MQSSIADHRSAMISHRLFVVLAAVILLAAPVRTQSGAFFFIQLSDPQFGMYSADKESSQETANFEFAVATVNRLKHSICSAMWPL